MILWSWIKSAFKKPVFDTLAEGPTVKKSDNAIFGIDVSHHNGNLDWAAIKKAGVEFAFLKASQGVSFRDPKFADNLSKARAVGIPCGAYHYFEPGMNIQAQIDNFKGATRFMMLELPPVLDWEEQSSVPPKKQAEMAKQWLEEIQDHTGMRPIIYTGPYFFQDEMKSPPGFEIYPLWIAHYFTTKPMIPKPWKVPTIHQFTEEGKLPGVPGRFDLNHLYGGLEALKAQV